MMLTFDTAHRHGIPPVLVFLAHLWAFAFLAPGEGFSEEDTVHVAIFHTNDMHGYFQERKIGKYTGGGIARIAGHFRKAKAEIEKAGGHAILVDAGDFYAGTPEGNMNKGRLCVEMMNAAGYSAVCLGNHEFDDGAENTEALAEKARFPFLCSNIQVKGVDSPPAWLKPYVILDLGGVKVGILGALTVDTKVISGGSGTMEFLDEVEALGKAVSQAKAEGAALVVALTHVGFDRDKEISKALPSIPLIIGGHSHTYLKRGWRDGESGALVAQAGGHATHLGRVDMMVSKKTGEVVSVKSSLVFLAGAWAPPDSEVRSLLEEKSADIRKIMDAVIGETTHALERGGRRFRGVSSPLGNLLADLMRKGGEADLGFHNRTGIRDAVPAGPVTLRQIHRVCPFGNTVFTMDLAGKDVLELLEYALKA
ncbi:MAG: bifunctional metallophosphatase/5'-nucleotidase, partial [Planctomycetota bacterium]